jgi:hypothetical protein
MAQDQTGLAVASAMTITIVCFFLPKMVERWCILQDQGDRSGLGKSSLQEDCEHVLIAIVDGLEDELKWLNEEERARLAVAYEGFFR